MSVREKGKLLPWLAGAGLAASQIALSSNCTLPRDGQCTTCGSCVVALGVLVSWALLKKRNGSEQPLRGPDRTDPSRRR